MVNQSVLLTVLRESSVLMTFPSGSIQQAKNINRLWLSIGASV